MKHTHLTVIVICLIGAAGCSPKESPSTPSRGNLNIAYSKLRISLPIFVAQEEGIFAKNHLNVTLNGYDTAQPMAQAIAEGKVDIAGYTALPITFNAMLRAGKPLYYLTAMIEDKDHRISYFLKRKGDHSINSLKDLAGKRIGILPTNAYKSWANQILKAVGANGAQIIQVAPQQELASLKSGTVSCLFTNDPMATAALANGVGEVIDREPACPQYLGDPFIFGSFNVTKTWADQHPAEFTELKSSLNEAISFIAANEAKAKQDMVKYIPAIFQKQVSLYPDALYWKTDKAASVGFDKIEAEYERDKIVPSKVDLKGLVQP